MRVATYNRSAGASVSIDGARIICRGAWRLANLHPIEMALAQSLWPQSDRVVLDMAGVTVMDTAAAWLLHRLVLQLEQAGRSVQVEGLAEESRALYEMVSRTTTFPVDLPAHPVPGVLETLGRATPEALRNTLHFIGFVGEITYIFMLSLLRPARIRWRMIMHEMGEAGYKALGIVGLLSFLMGVVIAYQGGVQLQLYGANIFIADLVGLSMLRELAPLMAAIIVAGRTGSAYTAQIGTMQVTEEVDALRTMGVTPIEMLVLPKVLALFIVLPLLVVYADIMGILGGMVMANMQLGIVFGTFIDRVTIAVSVDSYLVGLGKAPVFAVIIATVGCYQGFKVHGSAESVGRRTTVSVVQSIFAVIVVDAAFSIAFSYLGI